MVVAAFNQEKALLGAFSVITNLRMDLFEALLDSDWCSSFPDPSKNETNGLVIVSSPAQTRVDENSELLLECPDSQVRQILRVVELQTINRRSCTITKKAFKTLLRHYAKRALTPR